MSSGDDPAPPAASGPLDGSGSATIEPSMPSGAGIAGSRPRAPATTVRARRVNSRFRAMISGQPPGRSPPTNLIASGTASQGVGSSVPCQSNSAR